MWSDGSPLWIADKEDAKMYAYKLKTDESPIKIHCPDATKDFNTLEDAGNHNPKAIFSDGSTMWVVDNTAKKIFAYNQPLSGNAWLKTLTLSGVYNGAQPFHFSNPGLEYPSAYVLDRMEASTTVTAIAQDPNAIVRINPQDTNGTLPGHQVSLRETSSTVENKVTITVTSESGYIEKQYTITIARNVHGQYLPARNIDMHADNNRPTGIWSDETTMWVVNSMEQNPRIFAYNMWTTNQQQKVWDGSRDEAKEFVGLKGAQNVTPFGIWSDKTTMWVADEQENKIFAYVLESKMRPTSPTTLDFPFQYLNDAGNTQPRGLWSDGSTMWVSDWDKKIYAYKASDKTRDTSKEFDTLKGAGNQSPIGIWSDGTTMWVADLGRKKIFAYNMEDETNDPTKEFATSLKNSQPGYLWSDGKTLWVSDSIDQKIYAYNIKTAIQDVGAGSSPVTDDPSLRVLALSGIGLNPAFSANRTFYTALVDHTVASTTVTATPSQALSAVNVMYKRGGGGNLRWIDSDGSPIALQEGRNRIAVEVTSEDGSIRAYVIEVTKSEAPPVSGGPLPQLQSFQLSAASGQSQTGLASSATGIGEWKSQFIFAEPLPGGGVRFVFLVPAAKEFEIAESVDLLSGEWRPLLDDEFQATRESLGGQDRLTIILPKAEGKQRFLRLTPQR